MIRHDDKHRHKNKQTNHVIRSLAMDVLAPSLMKNAVKCDNWCELQELVNHWSFERTLRIWVSLPFACFIEYWLNPTQDIRVCMCVCVCVYFMHAYMQAYIDVLVYETVYCVVVCGTFCKPCMHIALSTLYICQSVNLSTCLSFRLVCLTCHFDLLLLTDWLTDWQSNNHLWWLVCWWPTS